MNWEFLIPLLMFAFPVAVALLDKRARQKRAASSSSTPPPFHSVPASPPGPLPRKRPAEPDPSQPSGWAPPSYGAEGGTVSLGRAPGGSAAPGNSPVSNEENRPGSPENDEEGVRAIHRKEEEGKAVRQPADKLRIDKKKLIIYSEILKPKFDA